MSFLRFVWHRCCGTAGVATFVWHNSCGIVRVAHWPMRADVGECRESNAPHTLVRICKSTQETHWGHHACTQAIHGSIVTRSKGRDATVMQSFNEKWRKKKLNLPFPLPLPLTLTILPSVLNPLPPLTPPPPIVSVIRAVLPYADPGSRGLRIPQKIVY